MRAEHNCVPRDIVSLGTEPASGRGLMLFGYNVFIGLKPETTIDDVFAVHAFSRDGDTIRFEALGTDILRSESFQRDFDALYRYRVREELVSWDDAIERLLKEDSP